MDRGITMHINETDHWGNNGKRWSAFDMAIYKLKETDYFTDEQSSCKKCGKPVHHYENDDGERYYFIKCINCIDKKHKQKKKPIKLANRVGCRNVSLLI